MSDSSNDNQSYINDQDDASRLIKDSQGEINIKIGLDS